MTSCPTFLDRLWRRRRNLAGRRAVAFGMVLLVAFSGWGTLAPADLRCQGAVSFGCPGGWLGPSVPTASGVQYFDLTLYDYGFWIQDTTTGTNESSSWSIFEGYTIVINATSKLPNPALGGTSNHGVGIGAPINFILSAPIGSWNQGSFVAPTSAYSGLKLYCSHYCGSGHPNMNANILNVVPPPNAPVPTASGSPLSGTAPLAVSFLGSATGGSPPYSWAWNFGDGTTGSTQNASHTYTSSGNFYASLTVTDSKGLVGTSAPLNVSVASPSPLAVASSGTPTSGTAPLAVSFSSAASGGVPPYSYAWSFGDGSSATGANVSHTYSLAGAFTATVTASDSAGGTATSSVSISVSSSGGTTLQVGVSASPTSGPAPLSVAFQGTASSGSPPYSFAWTFGDGGTGTGANVTHSYAAAGSYVATCNVQDSKGNKGSASTTISVTGGGSSPLTLRASASPSSGVAPLHTNATASVSGGSGTYNPVAWQMGDGTTATGSIVAHTYTRAGNYVLNATVTDSLGHTATATIWVNVSLSSSPLSLLIAASPLTGDAPFQVNASASVFGGTGPYGTVAWLWGDGSGSNGTSVSHRYLRSGNFTVRATEQDAVGQVASSTTNITSYAAPDAALKLQAGKLTIPASLTFAASVWGGSGRFAPILWDFGDLSTVIGGSPQSHTYTHAGNFTVRVSTNDSLGRKVAANLTVSVVAPSGGGPGSGNGGGTAPGPVPNEVLMFLAGMGILGLGTLFLTAVWERYDPRRRQLVSTAAKSPGDPPSGPTPNPGAASPSHPTARDPGAAARLGGGRP